MIFSLIDNFVHVPFLYTPVYFTSMSIIQGKNYIEMKTWVSKDFIDSILACWIFWIPANGVNFAVIPQKYQVIYMNSLNLIWSVLLNHLTLNNKSG